MKNLIVFVIIVMVLVIIRLVLPFPWWTFLFPIFITGAILSFWQVNVSSFWTGFLAGFVVWVGGNWFFDSHNGGVVMTNLGKLLTIPAIAVIALSGMIGGILCGLALYAGKSLFEIPKQ